jgi:hypothetical protein
MARWIGGAKATRRRPPPDTVNVADQLLSASSGACRSARRSCRSVRRSCRFSTRAWWPTQAEKNVQAAVAAKVSRSARAIRLVGIEVREVFIQSNSRLIEEVLASAVRLSESCQSAIDRSSTRRCHRAHPAHLGLWERGCMHSGIDPPDENDPRSVARRAFSPTTTPNRTWRSRIIVVHLG